MEEKGTFESEYLAYLFNNSAMPPISKLQPLFEKATREEFVSLVTALTENGNRDLFEGFLYYIVLFRDMTNIQDFINDEAVPVEVLERLLLYTHGHSVLRGYSVENILDEIFYFIKPVRLLHILLESKYISRDMLFSFFILTKLDRELLDKYFAARREVTSFVLTFMHLPEEVMRSIIMRNYRLFQYIMLLLMEQGDVDERVGSFYATYRAEIEQLSALGDIIRKYKKEADLTAEKELPFEKRNMGRIGFLVNKIRAMDDPKKGITYFDREKVFADEEEKELIYEIVINPMFRNTFLGSCDFFGTGC